MYDEDDLLPLSALQHLLFCERQCALIHIEGIWVENLLTVEGEQSHEKIVSSENKSRGGIRILYDLPLQSLRLGLVGKADVVEFHRIAEAGSEKCRWRVFPVEYKRGKPKINRCDEVQLCAQALCLEEMLGVGVAEGALFYGKTRRRKAVSFDPELRAITEKASARLHVLIPAGATPKAVYEAKCENCSLVDLCMPRCTEGKKSAKNYLANLLDQAE